MEKPVCNNDTNERYASPSSEFFPVGLDGVFTPVARRIFRGKEGVRREDEDSEEGGKAKGKEGVVRWGEEEGTGCKTKEAWPRH